MGYYLQAFVGRKQDVGILSQKLTSANIHEVEQGLALVMLTEQLFKEITELTPSAHLKGFEYLTQVIETNILEIVGKSEIAYVEASYWGGEGNQSGVIWKDGARVFLCLNEQEVINKVLRYFGVVAKGGYDEFDTLGFGLLESPRDWDGF